MQLRLRYSRNRSTPHTAATPIFSRISRLSPIACSLVERLNPFLRLVFVQLHGLPCYALRESCPCHSPEYFQLRGVAKGSGAAPAQVGAGGGEFALGIVAKNGGGSAGCDTLRGEVREGAAAGFPPLGSGAWREKRRRRRHSIGWRISGG